MRLKPLKPLPGRNPRSLEELVERRLPAWVPVEKIRQVYEENRPAFAAGGVVAAVLLVFLVMFVRHRAQQDVLASAKFREASQLYAYRVPPADSEVTPVVSSDEEKYTKAGQLFQLIVDTYPGARLAPAALFYAANCRYKLKQFSPALESFEQFLARYPHNALAAQANLGRGDCLEQLGRAQEALAAYQAVATGNGPLAQQGALASVRMLLRLPNRMNDAMQILNTVAADADSDAGRAARELRRMLMELSKEAQTAKPAPKPAARPASPAPAAKPAAAAPAAQGTPAPH